MLAKKPPLLISVNVSGTIERLCIERPEEGSSLTSVMRTYPRNHVRLAVILTVHSSRATWTEQGLLGTRLVRTKPVNHVDHTGLTVLRTKLRSATTKSKRGLL